MAEWFGAFASAARAVMRGLWVRAPSLLGRAALPTTGCIVDMMRNIYGCNLCDAGYEINGAYGAEIDIWSTRPKMPIIIFKARKHAG